VHTSAAMVQPEAPLMAVQGGMETRAVIAAASAGLLGWTAAIAAAFTSRAQGTRVTVGFMAL